MYPRLKVLSVHTLSFSGLGYSVKTQHFQTRVHLKLLDVNTLALPKLVRVIS